MAKASTPAKGPLKSVRDGKSEFGKDRRRKHHHFLVTVNYADGETFGRVYTNKGKSHPALPNASAALAHCQNRSRNAGFLIRRFRFSTLRGVSCRLGEKRAM